MKYEPGQTITCQHRSCERHLVISPVPMNTVWTARWRGWGIVDGVVLCPDHSGRQREARKRIREPLMGEVTLFDLPASATVPKRKKSKKATN